MKTEQYISQLLYRYQCVTVPGFGAFLTDIQSAQWHEKSNAFYPPKKSISFNSYLKNNDGLLANHIATAEKTTYENAVLSIENEVTAWKNSLQNNGKIALKNIGELSLNTEGSLVFTPYEQPNYLKAAFGLSSFVSPAVKREVSLQEVEITKEEPILITLEKRKRNPYLKYAAILVLAVAVTGSVGFKLYQDKIETDTLLVQTDVQKQVQNKIQEATFFIANPLPSVTLTVKEEKMPYHVVAGAFRQEENAEKTLEELNKKGFKAKRIAPNRNGLFPVLYGSYPSYAMAQTAMHEIQKSDNPDAWLLIEEL
ncbi:SPOR domain-containing protein [Flavobacterium sp. GT3R68]|uniref:HU domain-containing protein n=1 Tax=Flavobacterium sp. GT3R68 TaxID=2594437 RepID=UPI000F8786F1|nr:SPOR domain-containing protein [Flavobacterium sp. GT3R68]RTY95954.1 SPOR domain-containing protein [Flavobacterium sp. GSN2]TRW93726.1 SPOR domain-containing protein [Flavobacterium sp. GT3R68]